MPCRRRLTSLTARMGRARRPCTHRAISTRVTGSIDVRSVAVPGDMRMKTLRSRALRLLVLIALLAGLAGASAAQTADTAVKTGPGAWTRISTGTGAAGWYFSHAAVERSGAGRIWHTWNGGTWLFDPQANRWERVANANDVGWRENFGSDHDSDNGVIW